MAPRKTATPASETSLVFSRKTEKIHSVVYMSNTANGLPFTVYIPKDVLASIGNPTTVRMTLTAQ